jgi:hypothetical protein
MGVSIDELEKTQITQTAELRIKKTQVTYQSFN